MPELRTIRIGTRGSLLARWQTDHVRDRLIAAHPGLNVEVIVMSTQGDRVLDTPLPMIGGKGLFTAELEQALRDGTIDLAVHSLKDLPTEDRPGLVIAAIPPREDPRDALVARGGATLAELPEGARIGTGSPRRAAQLRLARPDLDVRPIRGNVDTRLGKVTAGEFDAVVVAAAGLARLGRLDEASELLGPGVMLPAPGQGALAVECRAADAAAGGRLHDLLAALDDPGTRAAVTAERAVLATLEAGCTAPVGAFAEITEISPGEADLHVIAAVVSVDGATAIRRSASGPASDAEQIGRRWAAELLAAGAAEVMGDRP